MLALLDRLEEGAPLTQKDFAALLQNRTPTLTQTLFQRAAAVRRHHYGDEIYIRGLIEFTNVCKNDCLYCGIRRSNGAVHRYRLTPEQILACCREGYALGYRTFVLQGGEDPYFTPERLETLITAIKTAHPDCALTLSVGEQPRAVYQRWYDAGADRYLLRHETANDAHYRSLHPKALSPETRRRCLWDLKDIGYQVGCGFMVGSPGQTIHHLAEDLCFLQDFQPDMVGLGPFLPQKDTPLGHHPPGDLDLTLCLLALVRLLLPSVLLPATTALGTLHPQGRELGIQAGANVCMPNLSPPEVRRDYALYDNKCSIGGESAQGISLLEARLAEIGCRIAVHRGDRKRPPATTLKQTDGEASC